MIILHTLISPLTEEVIKILLSFIFLMIWKIKMKIAAAHFSYFQLIGVCMVGSFAMMENVHYIAYCQWFYGGGEWAKWAGSCYLITPYECLSVLAWLRSLVTIPMHCISIFVIIALIKSNQHIIKTFAFPILLHLFHNFVFVLNAESVQKMNQITNAQTAFIEASILLVLAVELFVTHRTAKVFVAQL